MSSYKGDAYRKPLVERAKKANEFDEDYLASPYSNTMQKSRDIRVYTNSNLYQNDLSYSYSDIDISDSAQPKMQVFNYEPVFKDEDRVKPAGQGNDFNSGLTRPNIETANNPSKGKSSHASQIELKPSLNMFRPTDDHRGRTELEERACKPQMSVADAYRERKQQLDQRPRLQPSGKENASNHNQQQQVKESGPKLYPGGRTKEEILAQRKLMMKPKTPANLQKSAPEENQPIEHSRPALARMAKGEKAQVGKKEMLKLTQKNYEELPEVKKRKEEETKKQQYKERMQRVKESEAKRRELLRSKKF